MSLLKNPQISQISQIFTRLKLMEILAWFSIELFIFTNDYNRFGKEQMRLVE